MNKNIEINEFEFKLNKEQAQNLIQNLSKKNPELFNSRYNNMSFSNNTDDSGTDSANPNEALSKGPQYIYKDQIIHIFNNEMSLKQKQQMQALFEKAKDPDSLTDAEKKKLSKFMQRVQDTHHYKTEPENLEQIVEEKTNQVIQEMLEDKGTKKKNIDEIQIDPETKEKIQAMLRNQIVNDFNTHNNNQRRKYGR